jgi:hypothetical protein
MPYQVIKIFLSRLLRIGGERMRLEVAYKLTRGNRARKERLFDHCLNGNRLDRLFAALGTLLLIAYCVARWL